MLSTHDESSNKAQYIFELLHVWMWELDCEEGWAPKNWCFWSVVLEKTLESPLDCKETQPVHSERDQPWDFFGRTDAKPETPVLWPPHAKSWLIGKDSDAGRDWGQEEKGMTEDEMAGWHHWLDGHEYERTPGVGDRQGGLASCESWGHKESHDWATELTDPWKCLEDFKIFINFLLAVLGLHCCAGFSPLGESNSYSLVVVPRRLTVLASLLQSTGSWALGLE